MEPMGKLINVGITGQAGFIGTHLYNILGVEENIECIPFKDEYFESPEAMDNFVKQCDAIVHLAAVNRHHDPETLYQTNLDLVEKLVKACDRTDSKPHILFSSSIQESRDNEYGRSKREGRQRLEMWSRQRQSKFTGLVIPNVFGPFGHPYYNSVIATFSHQLLNDETPEIHVDSDLDLIYVAQLCQRLVEEIRRAPERKDLINTVLLQAPYSAKVSELLKTLESFKEKYVIHGEIPDIQQPFARDLFNTFRSYLPVNHFPFSLQPHLDNRGVFVEVIRTGAAGQFSFSTTKPGITRGNHFHTRKVERFAVIQGKARIQLRRIGSDEVTEYILEGRQPSFVDMPVWSTHNITNVGDEDLYTLFWINEPYDPDDPDTFFETV